MKIYIIGDSISIQYGPYLQQYLSREIEYSRKEGEDEALLNLDEPQGANGGDSSRVREFLEALARGGGVKADLLIVNCGLHDIKRNPLSGAIQVRIEDYERNLQDIAALAEEMGIALVWVRTTPCDEHVHNREGMAFFRFSDDVKAYNAVADRVMGDAGVPLIDLYTFTLNLGQDLYCDHVHFKEPIRDKQAAFLAGWLNAR